MKRCPVCNASSFDDMPICFGCLHRFDGEKPPLRDTLPSASARAIVGSSGFNIERTIGLMRPIGHINSADSGLPGFSHDAVASILEDDVEEPLTGSLPSEWPSVLSPPTQLASRSGKEHVLDLQFDASELPIEDACMKQRMSEEERSRNMFLAVDVGNTQTVLGLFDGQTLEKAWRIATEKSITADEVQLLLVSLFQIAPYSLDSVDGAALSSVVPRLTGEWERALSERTGKEIVLCTARNAEGLFQADYPNPDEIGQDRVADAIALRVLYGAPAIAVDFGTATNIEIIDEKGMFCGGVIAPGVETSMKALFSNASRLSMVELEDPKSAIGKNTAHAIQSGIIYGEADRVDGLLRRIFDELGYEPTVVATGGLAGLMRQHSRIIETIDPNLTLQGLRLLYEHRMG